MVKNNRQIDDMKKVLIFLLMAAMAVSACGNENKIPVMGECTVYDVDVEEISGLCLTADGKALLSCGDKGIVKMISFEGEVSDMWENPSDMEGITVDPATGHIYIAVERAQNVCRLDAPEYNSHSTIFAVQEAVDGRYWNDGLEGIEYYKDDILFVGSQRDANLWQYRFDGTLVSKISLSAFATEIADLCYDPVADWLWVVDSEAFKIFICTVDGELLATYDVSDIENAESICVDRQRGCVWLASDEDAPKLYKYSFEF